MTTMAEAFPGREIVDGTGRIDLRWRWRLTWARIKHALGFHTWILTSSWDGDIHRMIWEGYSCVICGMESP